MADAQPVVSLPRPLPTSVRVDLNLSLTPNEMRRIREVTGKPFGELFGESPEAIESAPDKLQGIVWCLLKRQGFEVTYEQAGDVIPELVTPSPPDPTSADTSNG